MLRSNPFVIAIAGLLLAIVLSACIPPTVIVSSSGRQPEPTVEFLPAPETTATPAQESAWKTYQADSGYQIRYPLETYSIRDTARGSADVARILYPGAKVVEPNDSFIYQNAGQMTYRISIAVTGNDQEWSLDAKREQLLAENPSAPYNTTSLADRSIQEVSLAGDQAIRVDEVNEGPLHITTEIVAIHKGLVFHLLVEPHEPSPNQAETYQPKVESPANKALVEEILSTFKFTDP